jgi:hypothetical protein
VYTVLLESIFGIAEEQAVVLSRRSSLSIYSLCVCYQSTTCIVTKLVHDGFHKAAAQLVPHAVLVGCICDVLMQTSV